LIRKDVPQNRNFSGVEHHPERHINRQAEPALPETAKDEAMCDLQFSFFSYYK
jgi:hypothetical protein